MPLLHPHTHADKSLLQRYAEGSLSPAEAHALERAALDDPFLSDALAGYRKRDGAAADLAALRQQLAAPAGAKVVAMQTPWRHALRIAAVCSGVLLAAWGAWQALGVTADENAAVVAQNVPASSSAVSPDTSVSTSTNADNALAETAPMAEPTVPATLPNDAKQKPVDQIVASRDRATSVASAPPLPAGNGTAGQATAASSPRTQADDGYAPSAERRAALDPVLAGRAPGIEVQGVVLDVAGTPLPNATVAASSNKAVNTMTDINGGFRLRLPDSTGQVTVAAVGYETTAQRLDSTGAIAEPIVLQQSNNVLNEVVVVGYGKKRAAAKPSARQNEPQPLTGWESYNRYLHDDLRLPKMEDEANDAKAVVQLSFDIDEAGRPVNIKVEQSLSSDADEEAIRLLKEGPKWKRKGKQRGRLAVQF